MSGPILSRTFERGREPILSTRPPAHGPPTTSPGRGSCTFRYFGMGLKQYLNMNRDLLVKHLMDRDALIEHLMSRDAAEEAEQLRARLRQRDAQIAILKSSLARETMRTPA